MAQEDIENGLESRHNDANMQSRQDRFTSIPISRNSRDSATSPVQEFSRNESPLSRGPGTVQGDLYVSNPNPDAILADAIYEDEGVKKIDATVRDPVSKETTILRGIRLSQFHSNEIQRISPNTKVIISVNDIRDIAEQRTDNMDARIIVATFGTENTTIPTKALMANRRSVAAKSRERACRLSSPFDAKVQSQNLHQLQTLFFMGDSSNPNSPGVLVDTSTQDVNIIHGSGQSLGINNAEIGINGPKFNLKGAGVYREATLTGGLAAKEHPLRNTLPASNILLGVPILPIPWIPDVQGILASITMAVKLVRMGQVINIAFDKKKRREQIDKGRRRRKREGGDSDLQGDSFQLGVTRGGGSLLSTLDIRDTESGEPLT